MKKYIERISEEWKRFLLPDSRNKWVYWNEKELKFEFSPENWPFMGFLGEESIALITDAWKWLRDPDSGNTNLYSLKNLEFVCGLPLIGITSLVKIKKMNFDQNKNDFWARDRTRALWVKAKHVSQSAMGQTPKPMIWYSFWSWVDWRFFDPCLHLFVILVLRSNR
jgi:hypothetical protein